MLKISKFLGICSYGMHIFLLHFWAIHAISFWVGPLWFSALQLLSLLNLESYAVVFHIVDERCTGGREEPL